MGFPVEGAAFDETSQFPDPAVGMDHPQGKAETLCRFPGGGETLRFAPAEALEGGLTGSRGREIDGGGQDVGHGLNRSGRGRAVRRRGVS